MVAISNTFLEIYLTYIMNIYDAILSGMINWWHTDFSNFNPFLGVGAEGGGVCEHFLRVHFWLAWNLCPCYKISRKSVNTRNIHHIYQFSYPPELSDVNFTQICCKKWCTRILPCECLPPSGVCMENKPLVPFSRWNSVANRKSNISNAFKDRRLRI